MEIVNDNNFETEVLKSELPVLVDFFAEWCGPCKMMSPVVEQIADDFKGTAKVVKLNVDDAPETAEKYGVMSIPTFILFKNGEVADKKVGGMPKDALAAMLKA